MNEEEILQSLAGFAYPPVRASLGETVRVARRKDSIDVVLPEDWIETVWNRGLVDPEQYPPSDVMSKTFYRVDPVMKLVLSATAVDPIPEGVEDAVFIRRLRVPTELQTLDNCSPQTPRVAAVKIAGLWWLGANVELAIQTAHRGIGLALGAKLEGL